LSQVLFFDVVPGVAIGVVVTHRLFNGMPRRFFRHIVHLLSTEIVSLDTYRIRHKIGKSCIDEANMENIQHSKLGLGIGFDWRAMART
jgi:hypothetical protein